MAIGYVSRAFGLEGEVYIKTFDPQSVVLWEVDRLLLEKNGTSQTFGLVSVAPGPGSHRVKLVSLADRTDSEKWVGSSVFVFREDLPPLLENEFYHGDLLGLIAKNTDGQPFGVVEEIQSFGPVPNLVIRSASGEEWVVPWAEIFVKEVSVKQGFVCIVPPEFME